MNKQFTDELLSFLDRSPNAFFAVANMKKELTKAGFLAVTTADSEKIRPGGCYYFTRNESSLIAVRIPEKEPSGFRMLASHADSPTFKIKVNAEIEVEKRYLKLNTEKYGGMILSSWLDRPLSVAGRVTVRTKNGVASRLICLDRDLLVIPNLAIHMDRKLNDGYVYNAQNDLLPLFGDKDEENSFQKLIAKEAGVKADDILETDLFLYNRTGAALFGVDQEYIGSGRLDDLQCVFASMKGFLSCTPSDGIAVHAVFDNEEVGSRTKQGAAGTFLTDVLHCIGRGLGWNEDRLQKAFRNSLLISADNAHAVHPNRLDKADPTNRPYLNGGIVIKYNADQKYTTDAVSAGLFRLICEKAEVPCQTYVNRSDIPGGSTLGNLASAHLPVNMVDIGLPQLAMHSAWETAGVKDTGYLIKAASAFFSSSLLQNGEGEYEVRW